MQNKMIDENIEKPLLTRRHFVMIFAGLFVTSFFGIRFFRSARKNDFYVQGPLDLESLAILRNCYEVMTLDSEEGTKKSLEIIQKFLFSLNKRDLFELKLGLRFFEHGGFLTFSRFSSLAKDEKNTILKKWSRVNGIRGILFSAIREISYLGYYSQDKNWNEIGYNGPVISPENVDIESEKYYQNLEVLGDLQL